MIAYFEPFIGVGEFGFGDNIEKYLKRYSFEYEESQGVTRESYTIMHPEITIYVNEDKVIESIGCYEECLYKGRNVIGMKIDEFVIHSGHHYEDEPDCLDFEEDNIPQYVYEFEDIGLQVWAKKDKIVTVIASKFEEE